MARTARGETLGLVGESGCGKSTTGRVALGLLQATSGSVRFGDHDVLNAGSAELRRLRRRMQIVSQDPFASLHPRMRVGTSIAEGLRIHRTFRGREQPENDLVRERVRELMALVELDPDTAGRYPPTSSSAARGIPSRAIFLIDWPCPA